MTELFNELSDAPVYLDSDTHVYVDKKTKKFYNSVTGALGLFKNKFDEKGILEGLYRQNTNFYNWYFKTQMGNPDNYIYVLSLYLNYKNFRQPTGVHPQYGLTHKRLTEYVNIQELVSELEYLKVVNEVKRDKNLYINEDFTPFDKTQTKTMWIYLTNIANHYGNIVHLTNERTLLRRLGIPNNLYEEISTHYLGLKKILTEVKTLFPHSYHSFREYEIDADLSGFIEFLEEEFAKVDIDFGRCVVPEKMLLCGSLAGMTDVYIDLNPTNFDIGDHKTNKKYTFYSEYDNRLLAPFDKMEECEHNLYTLQANIYATMIERTSSKILSNLWITYFDRKSRSYTKYIIERKKPESEYIIEYYHSWISKVKTTFYNSRLGVWFKETLPPNMEDHFFRVLYEDIQKKKQNNEMDDNKDKWEKYYKTFTHEYVQKHKYL